LNECKNCTCEILLNDMYKKISFNLKNDNLLYLELLRFKINLLIKKYSFFFITTFICNLGYSILYLFKFYSKNFHLGDGSYTIDLLYFQVSSTILLIIFSILNPVNLLLHAKEGIKNRKNQNKKYFDIGPINIISLDNKMALYFVTSLLILFLSIIILGFILLIDYLFPIIEFLEFPFRFEKNVDKTELYYGVYSFLFLNIGYILLNPQKSLKIIKIYLLKIKIYVYSGIAAFSICVFFILFNMFFYFDDIESDVFTDKAKIAFAMFFNIAFVFSNYLAENGYLKLEE
jgi:hypothetical protein